MATLRFALGAVGALIGCLLVAPVALGALIVAGFGSLTRFFVRIFEPRFLRWDELIEFEPHVGWKSRANVRAYQLAEDVYSLKTDADGWQGRCSVADSQIVVFGDSFASGYGIDDEHLFCNLTGAVKVKAVGSAGYNMVQELLWMRRLAPQLRGKLIVWFIYFGNDLYENLTPDMCGYRMPFVRTLNGTGAWEIVSSHISPKKWFYALGSNDDSRKYYAKLAELCSRSFLSEKAYPACEYLLREGRNLCLESGAELVVMTIPDVTQMTDLGRTILLRQGGDPMSFDSDLPDRQIGEICDRLGTRLVRLKDHLKSGDYKASDCHWKASGHRKVADLLVQLHQEIGWNAALPGSSERCQRRAAKADPRESTRGSVG
jgi:hypothetical protein